MNRRLSLLRLGLVIGVVAIVSLTMSAPAQSTPTVLKKTLAMSGVINGEAVAYDALVLMDENLHCVCDASNVTPIMNKRCIYHITWQTRHCPKFLFPTSDESDFVDLCDCNYDITVKWIDSSNNTLTLVETVTSTLSDDTAYVNVTGVWSGTCETVATGATVSISPIFERWHQVGPGHVQMSYVQHYTVDGQPKTLRVIKDATYLGAEELPYDEVLTISNIEVQYDEGSQVQHSEYDLSLAPAPPRVPALAQWGMIVLVLLLSGAAVMVIRDRRKTQTQVA